MVLALFALMLHGSMSAGILPAIPISSHVPLPRVATGPEIPRRLHVLVVVDADSARRIQDMSGVTAEVRDIWKPYVDLDFADIRNADGSGYDDGLRLLIVDTPRTQAPGDATALGWIEFPTPGGPSNIITVSMPSVTRLIDESRWRGRPIEDLPAGLRRQFVRRAVGRVIAHEIGHYLLRSSAHAPSGLMRGRLAAADILDRNPANIRLRPTEIERLDRRFAPGVLAEAPNSAPSQKGMSGSSKARGDHSS
jgi:hypothetical protein